jgi:hypothetical protein
MKIRMIVAAGAVLGLVGCEPAADGQTPTQRRIAAEVAANPVVPKSWEYRETTDPMTDGTTYFACVTSNGEVNLTSPYEPVTADLCIRKAPRSGVNVMVSLNGDGQMLCQSYQSCDISIRFGDGAPQTFSAIGPSDNSSHMVFIENESRFLKAVQSAPITRIQATFYQAGDQVMEFNTANLEWPRPTAE